MATIEARVIQKVATTAEWNTSDLILYKGELAFVSDARNFKVGTGTTKFSDTDWFFNLPTDVYSKTELDDYGVKNIYRTQLGNPTSNNLSLEYRNGTGLWNEGALNVPFGYGTWVNFVSDGGSHNGYSNWINQFLFPAGGGDFYFRSKVNSDAWSLTYKVITSKDYTSLSKIKENIVDYKESALDLINRLNIVKYDRIDTEQKGVIGILADAESTSDCFLSPTKDYIDVYQTLFVLAKAVQELSEKVK